MFERRRRARSALDAMARAAFFCLPGHGHVNPTLPLVLELVRRGETVDYYCTEEFRVAIESTGARFRPLLGVIERVKTLDPTEGMFSFGEFLAAVTVELLPVLLDELEHDRPDYVLYDSMTSWGRLVAQALGLPAITTYASFATLPDKSPLPPIPLLLLFMGVGKVPLNVRRLQRRRELAREAARRFGVDELGFSNIISNPSNCNIVFTSERFQIRRSDLDDRFHFVGASLSEPPDPDFPLSALEGRRVIYVSLGTVFNHDAGFFRSCIEAFSGRDDMVVIGAGKRLDAAALGRLPDNCIVRSHIPQLAVLGRSALFITHGGMNSVTGALFHGVPMLIRPQGADNFIITKRVEQLRLGRRLRAGDLKPARLRRLADELTGDATVRRNIEEVGDSLRAGGGPKRAADVVLHFRDQAKPRERSGGMTPLSRTG
jgi:MGT family glycosyltransferase